MSGQHHNDLPGDDAYDPSKPLFGPANDGSSDWFGVPDTQGLADLPEGGRVFGWSTARERGPGEPPESGPAPASRPDPYDQISRSDGGPTGFFGGSPGSGSVVRSGSGSSGPYPSGEYGSRRKQKRRRSALALIGPMAGAVVLTTLLGVGVYAFASVDGACADEGAMVLDVAAAPDIAPAVAAAARRFGKTGHEVEGRCVKARVRAAAPASVASLISGRSLPAAGNEQPDVWIPDSSLWTTLAGSPEGGGKALPVEVTRTSMAQNPLVVALPRTLAGSLQAAGGTAPSWGDLLKPAAGAGSENKLLPSGGLRLLVPDPARQAAGLGSLLIADTLLKDEREKDSLFTGIVRAVREGATPTLDAQFAQFARFKPGNQKVRQPVAFSTEQAVWNFNRRGPAEPAVALYPREGTLSLDYPFTMTTEVPAERQAARLFEQAVRTEATRADVRGLGLRAPSGEAPASYGPKTGVDPRRPKPMPLPEPAKVREVSQSWFRLSLGIRMLTLLDVSGTMNEPIAPGITRLQATARTALGGLSMMSDDTELGQWIFSTELQGKQDWREMIPVGPLGERIGSATRRQHFLSSLGSVRPKRTGDTGLFETLMAAYEHMTENYKPEFGNTVLLLTDGKGNDDPGGPSLAKTLATLKRTSDPNRPVQVVMIGIGKGVDTRELKEIAKVTPGSVYVAETPQQISKIFLQALSRRIAH